MKMDYSDYIEHYRADAEYNDYFDYNAIERESNRRRYQCLLNELNPRRDQPVLEIGSGGGEASRYLRGEYTYIPLDLSVRNLFRIRETGAGRIHPVNGDAFHLPFKRNRVYSVVLSEVLEHLADPLSALKELREILAPEGRIVVSVPYRERISYQICIHCNKPTPVHAHLHSFDEHTLKALLVQAGLEPQKWYTLGNQVAARLRLYRLMRFLPLSVWRLLDRLLNRIIPKPTHLLLLAKRRV